jgi:hypothetical protein
MSEIDDRAQPAVDDVGNGGRAFPQTVDHYQNGEPYIRSYHPGISIRDYFAAKAVQGCLAGFDGCITSECAIAFAAHSYMIADAMLRERAK